MYSIIRCSLILVLIHMQKIYMTTLNGRRNHYSTVVFRVLQILLLLPEGKEAGVFLIPIAPGIEDTPEIREQYFNQIIERFEVLTNQRVKSHILFKESYCVNDFINDYNSYKGNAYGLANILTQTAFLRPKIKSKKVENLFFTGQLTVPGPGVPPSLISGKIAAELIDKLYKN